MTKGLEEKLIPFSTDPLAESQVVSQKSDEFSYPAVMGGILLPMLIVAEGRN